MSTTKTFGQWLKQRRKALKVTQKELAHQAGCAEITLRKIEAGATLCAPGRARGWLYTGSGGETV